MITEQKMRKAYQTIVNICQDGIHSGSCPACHGSVPSTYDIFQPIDVVHKEDCEYAQAISWLSLDRSKRMNNLIKMIREEFSIECVVEQGKIVDCDLGR